MASTVPPVLVKENPHTQLRLWGGLTILLAYIRLIFIATDFGDVIFGLPAAISQLIFVGLAGAGLVVAWPLSAISRTKVVGIMLNVVFSLLLTTSALMLLEIIMKQSW